jgi:hypothetical protein
MARSRYPGTRVVRAQRTGAMGLHAALDRAIDARNLIDWSSCQLLTTSRDGSPLKQHGSGGLNWPRRDGYNWPHFGLESAV